MNAPPPSRFGMAAALWGVLGFSALLVSALWRLTPIALEPVLDGAMGLTASLAYGGFVVFNAWAEGYRAFQLRFSPMLAARAYYLARHPRPLQVLLAPLYCMGLFWATRKRLIISWTTTVGIVLLVVMVRLLPQPWRGVIDAGVVVGLAWGLVTTLVLSWQALRGTEAPAADPNLPA